MAKRKQAGKKLPAKSEEIARELRKLEDSRRLGTKLDKMVAKMETEEKKRKKIENLPPELILRVRELDKKKKFHRAVIQRVPRDFATDVLHLKCGHTYPAFAADNDDEPRRCSECMDRWLLRQAK